MQLLDAQKTRDALPFPDLIAALRVMFATGCEAPTRHHHTVAVPGDADATLLLMPAWLPGAYMGVKMVSVFPGNGPRGLPAVSGSYLLSSGTTGELLAIIDGAELTARRTAAASALAASYLASPSATRLLIVGAGRLALNLIEAHCNTRPINQVSIWARDVAKAQEALGDFSLPGIDIVVTEDLEQAARQADILSCATLSRAPLIHGGWLKTGAHLDLVGAFAPDMRETDDAAVLRASLFVDTYSGALSEGGDLVQPIRAGVMTADAVQADLRALTRGDHPGRTCANEITLFKSVGAASEDLAGAILAYERLKA